MRIKLLTPFKNLLGLQVEYVDLKDVLTGGDVLFSRRAQGSEEEKNYHLLARMSGLDFREVCEMDIRDILAMDAHVSTLFADPRKDADPKAGPAQSNS